MKIVELIALNQAKYTKVLILRSKDDLCMDPYIENISEKYIFNDMNLVDRDLYDIDAKDYFLLDKEAIKAIVYRDNKLDLDIDEEDKVLVVLI